MPFLGADYGNLIPGYGYRLGLISGLDLGDSGSLRVLNDRAHRDELVVFSDALKVASLRHDHHVLVVTLKHLDGRTTRRAHLLSACGGARSRGIEDPCETHVAEDFTLHQMSNYGLGLLTRQRLPLLFQTATLCALSSLAL